MIDLIMAAGGLFCVLVNLYIIWYMLCDWIDYQAKRNAVIKHASKNYCMCGAKMTSHGSYNWDHSPISEYDWHMLKLNKEYGRCQ